ncbi:hypothetical protein CHCC15292_2122 [Bacillus licheniformis]|nr:hypothetical protein CHCC15543_2685 [Bacillus licheniformis]TWL84915.1 hypothetical protein CHCC15292_2122 [Bacillus licheniformis]
MELSEKEEKEYKEQIIKHLAGIEKNTAVLQEISFLLRNSNDKQEEILKLITEMFEVLKSNTKEEVTSKFRNILDKINQFSDDVQTWQSLYTLGSTIYNTALQLNF